MISTYKVATVLEVNIDSQLRNKRKEKALEAINNLINKPEPEGDHHEQKEDHLHVEDHNSRRKHSKSAQSHREEHKEEKHESKHRKKKHKRK